MTVIENSVTIDRSPNDVFDYLVDLRNELEWNPDVETMQKVTEGPIAVGTKFLAKWKQSGRVEVVCTRFDRPDGWSYVNGGQLSVNFDARVKPEGRASRLTVRFDARPQGFLKLMFPILLWQLKRTEKLNMERIRLALEA